jgi:uncharacterized membrane protein YedE/YeeE
MTVDWASFTPWPALAGGAMIGLSAALFVLANGRIAGISGIVGGLLQRNGRGDVGWRAAFVVGVLVAPLLWRLAGTLPPIEIEADWLALIGAGVLVGVGTRYGSGCTSGHGVCGLSRLSPRSLAATIAFMLAGFATVYAIRHLV